ncbi:MAG: hypothetical protein MUD01_21295 [Chloroflexaceae bacterium]|jgi:hypothetical protein|nr:hypothetical protein [Chloroflexaceae bacterium]
MWHKLPTLVLLLFAACGTPLPSQPQATVLLAATEGIFTIRDGCTYLTGDDEVERVLVWPSFWQVALEPTQLVYQGPNGQGWGRSGERVRVGGGGITSLKSISKVERRHVPSTCHGRYWLLGGSFEQVGTP